MVEIDNEEQNDALHDEAVKQKIKQAWIGLSDTAEEGNWVWNSAPGEKASFTNWNSASPSNSKHTDKDGENCAVLATSLATPEGKKPKAWLIPKTWNDESCKTKMPVICQQKITLTKEAMKALCDAKK